MAAYVESSDSSGSDRTGENTPKEGSNSSTEQSTNTSNVFKNDGSFLELFKKKLEEEKRSKQGGSSSGTNVVETNSSHGTGSCATTTDTSKLNRLKDESQGTEKPETSRKIEQKTKSQETAAKKKYSLLSHVRYGMANITKNMIINFIACTVTHCNSANTIYTMTRNVPVYQVTF